jgi:hypothetical protein
MAQEIFQSYRQRKDNITMMCRTALTIVFFASAGLLVGCNKKQPGNVGQVPVPQGLGNASGANAAVAGVKWALPQRWTVLPPRQMRVVTYGVPAAEGDAEGGECGVFYFGNDQGGGVDANINRWISQFENSSTPARASKEVNGLKVATIQIAGTYLAPGGPMMQSQGKKENHRLLGAIVESPQGSVFFKFTGPAKTVAAAEGEFNSLIGSLTKE